MNAAIPRILVVVVSTDDGRWLADCLQPLCVSQCEPFDVTVVANACTDQTVEICAAAGCPVKVHQTAGRLGFAAANNLALAPATDAGYSYALLLNPDTRIHPLALTRLVRFLDERPEYGIAGCVQIEYGDSTWSRHNAWSQATLAHACELGSTPVEAGGSLHIDHYYVQGAALMLRLSLVPRIGLLDPVYRTFYEETDLCRRCLFAGSKVGIVLDSLVQHFGGGNWRANSRQKRERDRLFLRNQFFYYLSGCETLLGAAWQAVKLLYRQVRTVAAQKEDVTLPWAEYPGVLFQALAQQRQIAKLAARNRHIRTGKLLPRHLWCIGHCARDPR